MNKLSETVNTYYFGATRVVKTVERDKEGYIIQTKKVYFAGIKIFESSMCRQQSVRDVFMAAWSGGIE